MCVHPPLSGVGQAHLPRLHWRVLLLLSRGRGWLGWGCPLRHSPRVAAHHPSKVPKATEAAWRTAICHNALRCVHEGRVVHQLWVKGE